ncbi:MAG: sodium:proton antiporter [Leptospiraceae bacterium]|nr:sodium:proton antiporter [Leptospiraceae bacterium]MCP5512408.1 sodium:proton antiporter [Leptospiraceae bacterium]
MKIKKISSLFLTLFLIGNVQLGYLFAEESAPVKDPVQSEQPADEGTKDAPVNHDGAENKDQQATEHKAEGDHHGHQSPLAIWTVIPFALLLLSIAIFPIAPGHLPHWWENNTNKLIISLSLSAVALVILLPNGYSHNVVHQLVFDYIPFIILLTSLFYISGGIVLRGDIEAKPINNLLFLLVGAFLASFIGTTGASMLLIRPLLKTNSERKHVVHTVVFFIFMVSNIGGSLTPLGDPPLFLGYLKGVPFEWTFNLLPEMLVAIAILSVIYFIWDTIAYGKETIKDVKRDKTEIEPISLAGQINFLWLGGIILCAAFLNEKYIEAIKHNHYIGFIRELGMIALIFISKATSDPKFRVENKFTFHPIQEVAYLFIGIFITMIPALVLLETNGKSLGVTEQYQFFWMTGLFSSVLDNAPTYVVFLSLAQGLFDGASVPTIVAEHAGILKAISVGAVFMGANTYIGNAPNFMVKAVAEETNVKMPSFGGYVLYSGSILIPLFIVLTFIFFK